MKAAGLFLLFLLLLSGCNTTKTDGGGASQALHEAGKVIAAQTVQAPENPATVTKSTLREVETTTPQELGPPVVTRTRESFIEIGAAQDLAKILSIVGSAKQAKGVAVGLCLLLWAFIAYRKGNPIIAAVCATGAACSFFWLWWVGLFAALVAVLMFVAFRLGVYENPLVK